MSFASKTIPRLCPLVGLLLGMNASLAQLPFARLSTVFPPGTVVNGRADADTVDYFKFPARKGQRVLIECLAKDIDSRMDDTLILYDAGGQELERRRRGGLLDFIAPADGEFVLAVSDFT